MADSREAPKITGRYVHGGDEQAALQTLLPCVGHLLDEPRQDRW
ncbi:hypothetical protein [Arthrobacter sp. D1-29]